VLKIANTDKKQTEDTHGDIQNDIKLMVSCCYITTNKKYRYLITVILRRLSLEVW